MSDDYRYLGEMGECGSILILFLQDPERMMGLDDLWDHLEAQAGDIEAAVNYLFENSFLSGAQVPREGHPRQHRRKYAITEKGFGAALQLNT